MITPDFSFSVEVRDSSGLSVGVSEHLHREQRLISKRHREAVDTACRGGLGGRNNKRVRPPDDAIGHREPLGDDGGSEEKRPCDYSEQREHHRIRVCKLKERLKKSEQMAMSVQRA